MPSAKKPTAPITTTIGMDLVAPFGIYTNGELIATHDQLKDAEAHYNRLLKAIKQA